MRFTLAVLAVFFVLPVRAVDFDRKGYAQAVLDGFNDPAREARLKAEIKPQIIEQVARMPKGHPRPNEAQIDKMAADAAKQFTADQRAAVENAFKLLGTANILSNEI